MALICNIMEKIVEIIKKIWNTTLGKVVSFLLVLSLAVAYLLSLNSCGATARVAITNRAEYTKTSVTMNTNQPTTVTVTSSVDSNKVFTRTDTIKTNQNETEL